MLEVISGMKCAIESSNLETVSAIKFLKFPVGVSNMTPIGTRSILSAILLRIFFNILYVALCDIKED